MTWMLPVGILLVVFFGLYWESDFRKHRRELADVRHRLAMELLMIESDQLVAAAKQQQRLQS